MKGYLILLFSILICVFSFSITYSHVNKDKLSTYSFYLGRGYDIIFGYPFPNGKSKIDPGFKEVIIDSSYIINEINDSVCHRDDYLTVIDGINSFMDAVFYYVNAEEFDNSIKPFSASLPYLTHFENLEIKKKKYAISQNICLISYATFNISDSTSYMNKDFLKAIENLPQIEQKHVDACPTNLYVAEANKKNCKDTLKRWIDFFQKYGTHLLIAARFGGATLHIFEISNKKATEIKITNYKYSIKHIPSLNIDHMPEVLLDDFLDVKKKEESEQGENNIENKNKEVPWDIEIKGGIEKELFKGELTFENWKSAVSNYFVPIHLDLMLLSALMGQEKQNSYELALSYYNELFGLSKKKVFLTQDITKFLTDGIQITKSGSGLLTLTCPEDTLIGTGFIISIDTSGKNKNTKNSGLGTDTEKTDSRIRVHPCKGGEFTTFCSYMPKKVDSINFGWVYCVKKKFEHLETLYKNGEDEEINKPLKIECPETTALALGFHIKLDKKAKFHDLKFETCKFGATDCKTPYKVSNTSDSVIWGFCISLTLQNINTISNYYISEKAINQDVYTQCINKESIPQNVYLGFTFSFPDSVNQINTTICEYLSETCIARITAPNEKHYIGALVICKKNSKVIKFKPLLVDDK